MDYPIPEICHYCGGKVKLAPARELYGCGDEHIYYCTNCNAAVNCYRGTTRPMGKVANSVLRMKRRETHSIFDRYWKKRGFTRSEGYVWLAKKLGVPEENAHIGNMEMDECAKVIAVCKAPHSREAA